MPRTYKRKDKKNPEETLARTRLRQRERWRRWRDRQRGEIRAWSQENMRTTTTLCRSPPQPRRWESEPLPVFAPEIVAETAEEADEEEEPMDLGQPEEQGNFEDSLRTSLSQPGSSQEVQDEMFDSSNHSTGGHDVQDGNGDDPTESPNNTLADEDDHEPSVDWLACKLAHIRLSSACSDSAIEKMFKFFLTENAKIMQLYNEKKITSSYLYSVKPTAIANIPRVRCAVKVRKQVIWPDNPKGTPRRSVHEDIIEERDLNCIPSKYLRPSMDDNFLILSQEAYVSLQDIKEHFKRTHKGLPEDSLKDVYKNAILGLDGVRESQRGSKKLIIVTLMLGGCLYPWRIYNNLKGDEDAATNAETQLRPMVQELLADNEVTLKLILADKVERHVLRFLPGITGKFSCECCVCPGQGLSGGWPFPYATKYNDRNHEEFLAIARNVRGVPAKNINRYETKGILGYSPIFDLPGMNIIDSLPLDEFHLLREGITKLMAKRIFIQSKSKDAVQIFQKVNKVYSTMRVFSECPRRTRTLARLEDFKGNELLLVTMAFFPYLLRHGISQRTGKWMFKRKALALYTFLCRCYFYKDDVLESVEGQIGDLQRLHKAFYKYFQLGFAIPYNKAIPPNIHCFWHLLRSRKFSGPLWETSTEAFESMYSVIRRSFRPGTANCPKQIFQNYYLRDLLMHSCRNDFKPTMKPDTRSSKYCDSMVKTYNGRIWKIFEVQDDGNFKCSPVKTGNYSTNCISINLPWSLVGVSTFIEIDEEAPLVQVSRQDVSAKIMKCRNILTEWCPEWIRDSKRDY